jgi:hypothetical protein
VLITLALRLVLLVFAVVAYAGAGSSAAVIRQRHVVDGESDWGMAGVAGLLAAFAALCTALAVGWSGVLAFGGAAMFVSYVLMAQHIGLFKVDVRPEASEPTPAREPRQPK